MCLRQDQPSVYLEGPNCLSFKERRTDDPPCHWTVRYFTWSDSQITWTCFTPQWMRYARLKKSCVCAVNLQWHGISYIDSCTALGTANCWRLQRRHIFLVRWTLLSESDLSRLRRHITAMAADFKNQVFISQCGFSQFPHALGYLARRNALF